MNYKTEKTNKRVENTGPDLVTRFRHRAVRRRDKLNARLRVDFYRWEVTPIRVGRRRRWAVVAFQNVAVPK